MKRLAAGFLMLAFLAAGAGVFADYERMDSPSKRFHFLVDTWSLDEEKTGEAGRWCLEFTCGTETTRMFVNFFILADNVNSDSICAGDYKASMQEYCVKVAARRGTVPLMITLGEGKHRMLGGTIRTLEAFRPFDAAEAYVTATKWGSNLLNLTPEEVQKLGSAEAFEKCLRDLSARSLADLKSLPPPTTVGGPEN